MLAVHARNRRQKSAALPRCFLKRGTQMVHQSKGMPGKRLVVAVPVACFGLGIADDDEAAGIG